jgi:hypothetical protein
MQVHEEMFDEFFARRLPDEGFLPKEGRDDYFGLLQTMQGYRPELHGHVVTMDGTVIFPELRPSVSGSVPGHLIRNR